MKIPLARPWFDEADEQSVLEALRSGWVGQGPKVAAFEAAFAAEIDSVHATAVSSCTAALHLAAIAAGFGPGDEVLVPAFTWISSVNAIEYVGATPVFCDVDSETLNIDMSDAASRITERTRGIIPVHLFGLAADMEGVLQLARRHELFVIEDAACALGTHTGDRHVGTLGDVGCFSFHPRKSITTGEGGMLTSSRISLDTCFRSLRDIGSDRSTYTAEQAAQQLLPDYSILGYNFRLTDLQAALGLSQLAKFDRIMQHRLASASYYHTRILGSPLSDWLRPPPRPLGRAHAYQAYVCQLSPPVFDEETLRRWHQRRNALMQGLAAAGVATRPGTHAPHMQSYYRQKYKLAPSDFPVSWRADWLTIALPLYSGLSETDQELVCVLLEEVWARVMAAESNAG